MGSKFYARANRLTKRGVASMGDHINRLDMTSQMRILPHVPEGHQAIYIPLAKKAFMRGSNEVDFVSIYEGRISSLGAQLPPHRRDGGAPHFCVHHMFQLDQSRLFETNESSDPVLSRLALAEEYERLGHEVAWDGIFSKLNKREVKWLKFHSDSHFYQGFEGYFSAAQNLAVLEHKGKVARDPQNPVFQKGFIQTLNIMKSIYPEDVFHPGSILMAWSDLDERGFLKYEFMVCPLAKRRDGRYQVSASRAFSMLKEKYNLNWWDSNAHALCLETVTHLAKDGYVYEPEHNLGKSAKQDVEAIADLKIQRSAVQTEVDIALEDLSNLDPKEDMKLLNELDQILKEDLKPALWGAAEDQLKVFEQRFAELKKRTQERKYLVEHHELPKRTNIGSSPSPF